MKKVKMMNAAVYRGPRDMRTELIPIPELNEDEVLIKVVASGICGSDLHRLQGGMGFPIGGIMGHEYSGVIEKVGSAVPDTYQVGDKVVVNAMNPCRKCEMCQHGLLALCSHKGPGFGGGFAEYVKVPISTEIIKFPEKLSFEEAIFVEPIAVAIRAVRRANIDFNDIVLIQGMGTIGLSLLSVVKTLNTKMVIVTDVSDKRLNFAKEMGADYCINTAGMSADDAEKAVGAITGMAQHGAYNYSPKVDVVFESAGAPITADMACRFARGGGTVVLTAYVSKPVSINTNYICQKELNFIGSLAYNYEFPQAIALLESGKINVKALISHVYPFDKVEEAFAMAYNKDDSIKVIFKAADAKGGGK